MIVAALYVQPRGHYVGRSDVDAWPERRDARTYAGPHPVVAHPPCASWCRLAALREAVYGLPIGEDGGCFAAALAAVRSWGGVLEHPAWSKAWPKFGLMPPPAFGWQGNLERPREWVCEVAQSAYGHRAQKLTWLLYVGDVPPFPLRWERPRGTGVVSGAHFSRGRKSKRPNGERIWQTEASRTPPAFAEALIQLANHSRGAV